MAISFNPDDLVVSLVGNTDGSNPGDNQASPIELEQLTTSGIAAGSMLLPQTATTVNGVKQNPISGEYGSSSEGSLQLAANGQSLVIAGYAINAQTYNTAEASGGPNTYGNAALAQTYSVANGGVNGAPAGVTPVARVVADINANGTVDTSTALLNIFNTNNPRSVATTDGTSFYLGGQGVKGDATQGVFLAQDGASSATAINTADDVRTVELSNAVTAGGQLYVSQDSKQPSTGGTSNVATVGTGKPTAAVTETPLPGISQTVTLANGNGNANNMSTGTVHLSPENFFFANANTLYVADGGLPKQGGAGDGGLQKYSLVNGTWNLDYTLSSGLGIVATGTADPGAGGSGTTGLIGLTGRVVGGSVNLYATNATVGDLNQTNVFGITDTLADTTASQASGEQFSNLFAAPAGTNVRGIAFAPVCFAQGTRILTTRGDVAVETLAVGDLVITSRGAHRPVRWLGHRSIECARHPHPDAVLPVRIAAHAFGEERPARDLMVSPGHSVAVDILGEVLIPASALINGTTIVQEEVERVTYWHVELESHDVILAEGLPAESYLDMGNRDFFAGGAATALHGLPDAPAATHADFCRPFHADGDLVRLVRERLSARAAALGWSLVEDPLADLHLEVDGCRLQPQMRGSTASFLVPAGASAAWLVSETRRPSHLGANDARALGLCVAGLAVQDGFGHAASMKADDSLLDDGFHGLESGPMRWTAGRALLPAALWEGCDGAFFLRVDFAHMALPRWQFAAPASTALAA